MNTYESPLTSERKSPKKSKFIEIAGRTVRAEHIESVYVTARVKEYAFCLIARTISGEKLIASEGLYKKEKAVRDDHSGFYLKSPFKNAADAERAYEEINEMRWELIKKIEDSL